MKKMAIKGAPKRASNRRNGYDKRKAPKATAPITNPIATIYRISKDGNRELILVPESVPIKLDGAYMPKGDRNWKLNDPYYVQPRLTQKFTDNFNAIAMILPVFERFRQLTLLQHTLVKARELVGRVGSDEYWAKKVKEYEANHRLTTSNKFLLNIV